MLIHLHQNNDDKTHLHPVINYYLLNEKHKLYSPLICYKIYYKILYLIFDYPHKHYTFKYFEV